METKKQEVKFATSDIKQMIGNYTAEVVKRKWIEDFVDKSTGQVVSVDRYEKIYRFLIEDTLKRLPNVKIMLVEPFVVSGTATNEKQKNGNLDYLCRMAKAKKKLYLQ